MYLQHTCLNVHSEEATLGCWPSTQSGKEKSHIEIKERLRKAGEHRDRTEEEVKGEQMLEECLTPSVRQVEV